MRKVDYIVLVKWWGWVFLSCISNHMPGKVCQWYDILTWMSEYPRRETRRHTQVPWSNRTTPSLPVELCEIRLLCEPKRRITRLIVCNAYRVYIALSNRQELRGVLLWISSMSSLKHKNRWYVNRVTRNRSMPVMSRVLWQNRYQWRGQVIISHRYCGMWLLVHALYTCF